MSFAVVAASCEKYDEYDTDRIPVVGFTTKNKNINGIKAGTTKSTTIDVFASDVSSTDRTFEVVDIAIDNTTEYPPTTAGTYTFDSTVTIPAGERIGTIEVIGDNTNGDIGSSRTYFRLSVKSTEGVAAGGTVTVGLKN